jgi:hypothetical protein
MLFLNMVCLNVALAGEQRNSEKGSRKKEARKEAEGEEEEMQKP